MAQSIGEAGNERYLRPDDDQIDVQLAAEGEQALGVFGADRMALAEAGDSGVPGRRMKRVEARALRELPGECVLAPARPDDEDPLEPSLLIGPGGKLLREAAAGLLVARGEVEGVRIGAVVRRGEHDPEAAERPGRGLGRLDQAARDASAAVTLGDDESKQTCRRAILFEQRLGPDSGQPDDLARGFALGDEHLRRRLGLQPLEPSSGLVRLRWIAEPGQEPSDRGGIVKARRADRDLHRADASPELPTVL
jgi:hypothetical protein